MLNCVNIDNKIVANSVCLFYLVWHNTVGSRIQIISILVLMKA